MSLLGAGRLPLLLLNLFHELLDLVLEALLELLLHLGVFLQLLCCLSDGDLQLFTTIFTLTENSLILSDVLLQVVENLKLFVQGNKSVQLVLKFDFILFEQELQFGVFALC